MRTKSPKQTSETEYDSYDESEYEEDLRIDPDNLDVEFLHHPMLAMKYGRLSAIANKEAKEAEERIKTIRSLLVKRANEEPDVYLGKGVKPTAPVVEAYYRTDPKYKRAKEDWIEATYNAEMCNHAVFAVQARKTTLENMVRLIGLEYNSTPLEPRDLPEVARQFEEARKKSTRNKVADRMNNK